MHLKYIILFAGILTFCQAGSQTPFIYNPQETGNNILVDCVEFEDKLYALEIVINSNDLPLVDILNMEGDLLLQQTLELPSFRPLRVLQVKNESLTLLGKFSLDTCSSVLAVVEYDLAVEDYTVLSQLNYCDQNIQNLRLIAGLNGVTFIQGYYVDLGWNGFLVKLDTSYHLEKQLDSIGHLNLSINFSRKGYILKNDDLCYFYDADFNLLKENYSFTEGITSLHQSSIPYDKNYILENFGGAMNFENHGQYLRVVDSNLAVKNQVIIPIGHKNTIGEISPAFFGGVTITVDSILWVVGNNNITSDLDRATHFSISKLHYGLDIECTQYVGFDAFYRIYGITTLEQGGLAIYGTKFQDSYNPFLLVIGPNCELPTVSTDEDNHVGFIRVYPNPTNDILLFDFEFSKTDKIACDIYNTSGLKIMHSESISGGLNVSGLLPGQYFYNIVAEDKIVCSGEWIKY